MSRATVHRASVRTPLAFLLLPLLGGYGLAELLRPPPLAPLAAALVLAMWAASALGRRGRETRWALCFLSAAVCGFWADGLIRRPVPPDFFGQVLPARESRLLLRIERVFTVDGGAASTGGLARVLAGPKRGSPAAGSRVFFRVRDDGGGPVRRGSLLLVTGLLERLPAEENGGGDGFHAYLRKSAVFHLLERGEIVRRVAPPPARARFYAALGERFGRILSLGEPRDPGPGAVYRAMLLGHKSGLDEIRQSNYRNTGSLHFFAISGLHIGVIATALTLMLGASRVPGGVRPLVVLPLLYVYVQATGAPPSAVRAFLMVLFFWLAGSFSRQRSPVAALAASATFVLLLQPTQLGSPGFQLSYAVVLGILLFGLPLHDLLAPQVDPFADIPEKEQNHREIQLAKGLRSGLLLACVSVSAWLASAPLCAAYFGILAPVGIVLNLLLVHLASLVIVTGMLSLLLGTAGLEPAAAFINHGAWITIGVMDRLVEIAAGLPGATFTSCHLSPGWAVGALAVFFSLLGVAHAGGRKPSGVWLAAAPAALLLVLALGLTAG